MPPLTDLLDARYRLRLAQLRQQILDRLTAIYGEVITLDDIDAEFASFIPQAAIVVEAGQGAGVAMASGYLAALVSLAANRAASLPAITVAVGQTAEGVTLAEGMAAFPAMVKDQIAQGVDRPAALQFGRFLAERFGDAEVTSAVDRQTEITTRESGDFIGWVGVLSPGACGPCRANAGFHELNVPIYRHGSCNCSKQFVVAQ